MEVELIGSGTQIIISDRESGLSISFPALDNISLYIEKIINPDFNEEELDDLSFDDIITYGIPQHADGNPYIWRLEIERRGESISSIDCDTPASASQLLRDISIALDRAQELEHQRTLQEKLMIKSGVSGFNPEENDDDGELF